jgi:hypothetical protein
MITSILFVLSKKVRPKGVKCKYSINKEYKRLKEIAEDKADYLSALEVKLKNKKWKSHTQVKKELGL